MSKFLKDGTLEYLTITNDELTKLNDELVRVANQENSKIDAANLTPLEKGIKMCTISYVLRADGKGVRYVSFDDLIKDFDAASNIERLIVTVNNKLNIQSGQDKRIELKFDVSNEATSSYLIEDDDNTWVEGVAKVLISCLDKFGNHNRIFYSHVFIALFQIAGVAAIFLLSMWLSFIISPYLNIESAFLFSFIGVILLLSNLWTFISLWIKGYIDRKHPKIQFRKGTGWAWLWQGLVVTFVGLGLIALGNKIWGLFLK